MSAGPLPRPRAGRRRALGLLGCALLAGGGARAQTRTVPAAQGPQSRFVTASDGTRLHYLDTGPPDGRIIMLVPGWTMPAWIFAPQIAALSRQYRVIAFDPRAQGESEVARGGYDHVRRGQDIAEVIARLGTRPMVLLAWSLAVLEVLAYVKAHGDGRVDGFVLVDNSVGEDPPPVAAPPARGPKPPHDVAMRNFVRGMFRHPQPPGYLERLTRATLKVPEPASRALLAYPVPRSYWREAIYAIRKPILYVVRPKFAGQAQNLGRNHPSAESVVLSNDVGHALFVDDPAGFNALVLDFIHRKVWR